MYETDFHSQQELTQALPAPEYMREQRSRMEWLPPGEEVQIDTNTSIYPPEWIGLSAQEDDTRVNIVGEIGVPGAQITKNALGVGFAALIKEEHPADAEHPNDWVKYGIQGLKADSQGRVQVATGNGAGRVYFPPEGVLIIGRNPNHLVSSKALWGTDAGYGLTTSRSHVRLVTAYGLLFVEDLKSKEGTLIRAQTVGSRNPSDGAKRTTSFATTPEAATEQFYAVRARRVGHDAIRHTDN